MEFCFESFRNINSRYQDITRKTPVTVLALVVSFDFSDRIKWQAAYSTGSSFAVQIPPVGGLCLQHKLVSFLR
ncbi:hypothetical protein AC249_AIPGENE5155 [Exaiptasia diaphana]|nr:hypothetical protein AC249_AIPGENE5155 [Exaiptasia diaphana]